MLKLKFQYLATWWEELTHWKRPWCWERLKAGGEGDDRGQDGWIASPIQWRWVWASSRRWGRTSKPGFLQSMWFQSVGHDWVTEQQQQTKWNGSTEYEIEKVKQTKGKRSSYSPVVFKHDGSLETYLELWSKKAIPEHLIFFLIKITLICYWILKSDYMFFYWIIVLVKFSSIIFLLTNHDTMILSE